jgi:hypothetical protein
LGSDRGVPGERRIDTFQRRLTSGPREIEGHMLVSHASEPASTIVVPPSATITAPVT